VDDKQLNICWYLASNAPEETRRDKGCNGMFVQNKLKRMRAEERKAVRGIHHI
jgi:hypothetical protein